MRIKEQETRLILHEHDDDDDGYKKQRGVQNSIFQVHGSVFFFAVFVYWVFLALGVFRFL